MDEQTKKLLEAMSQQMEQQRLEIQRLQEQANKDVNGNFEDSLNRALREFREQNEHELPGLMSGPCHQCGLTWRDTDGEIRAKHRPSVRGGHSFRSYESKEAEKIPYDYRRTKGVRMEVPDPELAMAESLELAGGINE